MKFFIQVLFALLFLFELPAQATLSESFESYNNGDLITIASEDWNLWPLKGKDTQVTNEKANTGSYSLKLEGKNYTDIYYPFRNKYTAGSIEFSMHMYIPEGSNGYFSFQGLEQVGQVWSLQCYLDNNGFLRLVDDSTRRLQSAYPQDQWFKISVEMNLDTHFWQFSIDDHCVGSYVQDAPAKQTIASLALYSNGDNSLFYVDDITFVHTGLSSEENILVDCEITEVFDFNQSLNQTTPTSFANINGTEYTLACLITNTGQTDITSITLALDVHDKTTTEDFEINLNPDTDTILILDQTVTSNGKMSPTLAITQVNGSKDDNDCNDIIELDFQGFTLHPDRQVWVEEATGTWCPWCPRGQVYMGYLSQKYPNHFVGISAHQNDPMELVAWIGKGSSVFKKDKTKSVDGLVSYLKGFPSVLIDRKEVLDPNQLEVAFLKHASEAPIATLTHTANWNPQTRELEVSITAHIRDTINQNINLIVGLTEDKVSGKGKGWAQQNAYSGGQEPMSGYEALPSPVPDSMMVYNHVAKLLFTPFQGESLEVNAFQPEQETITRVFTHRIPGDWNLENMNIVSSLVGESHGIYNANRTSVTEALSNNDK